MSTAASTPLDATALDQIFRNARSQNRWIDEPVSDDQLRELHDLMKWGPTSGNGWPARFVYVRSAEGKEKLAEAAMGSNATKILQAPVTVIIGHDLRFFEKMDELFPHDDTMPKLFAANEELARVTAVRNGSLQGAYLMVAARSLGLDVGPMSGFDNARVDELFFAGTNVVSNFICSLGQGDPEGLFPRLPRPAFDEVCELA